MKPIFLFIYILLIGCLISCTDSNSTEIEVKSINYKAIGDSLSNLAQQALLKEVSLRIHEDGIPEALSYCNIKGLALIDSMTNTHNVIFSRLSTKNRNPLNAPSTFETSLLKEMESLVIYDTLILKGKNPTYYKSIHLGMPACLKCHGVPNKDISAETISLIDSFYPKDLARNYSFSDFRGAWRIEFPEE